MDIWAGFEPDGKILQDDHLYGLESGNHLAGTAGQFDSGEMMCNGSTDSEYPY